MAMLVKRYADVRPVEAWPGMIRRTLHYGEKMLMVEYTLAENAAVPWHSHPHEQIGYLIRGRVRLEMGDQQQEAGPGDSWLFPSDQPHAATALAPSVVVEVFSPLREEFKDEA